ncbi:MAG: SGNH/GDSL hydrolase family protein [Deltaproteobacteria bacterium]|nr:SGNH/GDSL hydrolase family protein [Deltaproteobacteria bacterium]
MMTVSRKTVFTVAAAALGLACVALVFELAVLARSWWDDDEDRGPPPRAGARVVILCAGDSHTQGVGARRGRGYPGRLAAMLEKERPGYYDVINLGAGGANTSQAVESVRRWTAHYPRRASVVIFNAGFNNVWNLRGASILPEDLRGAPDDVLYRRVLAESATWRLGQITRRRIEQFLGDLERKKDEHRGLIAWEGEGERAFLTRWIVRDLENLADLAEAGGAAVALLNYWNVCAWQSAPYESFAATGRAVAIDVTHFGIEPWTPALEKKLTTDDRHPNEEGYARIAGIVHRALDGRGLLDAPAVTE